ncbi:MAG: tRNA (adenosine(37)-N6)-dimethylallyltransferase MiaA [Parcubacteria group bacterium QH_9_35_7]|nr:MAG: tRNA (adenosine(37)-N6)-dimethylallyltransferase MiaA [Parcubacteria group bacterium QH_9_35_7]
MIKNKLSQLIVILGPTAAGKTSWSLDISSEIDTEIISADSRQVYKYMNIGTAKPKGEHYWFLDEDGTPDNAYVIDDIPHYLVDFLEPDQEFNLARFQQLAKEYIRKINKKSKTPMIVGGTGLYIQSIVDNYQLPQIPPNEDLRKTLSTFSSEELIDILAMIDEESAQKIHKNNTRRLIRAIEVSTSVGKPFSEVKGSGEQLYDTLQIGVEVDREELYEKINKRVESMFEQGLKNEVEQLLEAGYDWDLSSMNSIGYKEFKSFFEDQATLTEVRENIKANTRNYARKQLSWFRRDDRINWCKNLSQAKRKINNFLTQ